MRFEERKWFWAREGAGSRDLSWKRATPRVFWIVLLMWIFLGGTDRQLNFLLYYYFFFLVTTGSKLWIQKSWDFRFENTEGIISCKTHCGLLLFANTLGHPDTEHSRRPPPQLNIKRHSVAISLILCPLHLRAPGQVIQGELEPLWIFLNHQVWNYSWLTPHLARGLCGWRSQQRGSGGAGAWS